MVLISPKMGENASVCINVNRNFLLVQIVLEHLGKDAHSIHLGINLDSGLGVFDGFLASLCMILVSEVCSLDSLIYSKASSIIVHIAYLYCFYFYCSPCPYSIFKIQFLAWFLSV